MRRTVAVCLCLLLAGLATSAQFRPMFEVPETDPKAFDITTRADLEDSIRRVRSLRTQLAEARSEREKNQVMEQILALCQDELGKQANASGAIITALSTDRRTPNMAVRWTGAFAYLEATLRDLGADGLDAYERLYGPRAERLLQDALASRDLTAMESLNRRFGLTQAGLRAATLLATMYWERGEISAAARALERALHAPELLEPRRRAALSAWLSHCYRALGERANLARLMADTSHIAETSVDEGGVTATLGAVLRRNLESARDTSADTLAALGLDWPGGNYTNTGLHPQPTDYTQIAWARALPRLESNPQPPFMDYPRPLTPPYLPVFDGNAVYVNTGDRLAAYDLVGGGTGDEPLWSCKPFARLGEHWRTTEPDPAMILPVSVWRGTVYAALENPLHTAYHDRNPDPMFGLYSHYPQVRRALCAVDAATGRLLWKLGGLYEGTADQTTSFLYATVYDGVLYAVGTRLPQFSEIHIYALNPVTGEVLWNLRACYGQQETTMFGRPARTPYPSLCAISGGNLYLCTNLGGVVSVNLARRCLNWISRYDHVPRPITKYTNTYYRPVGWANNPTFYTELDGRPWLVFAPADSDYAYGMDARSGEIVWRLDRHAFLGGGRVLVGLRGPTAWVASDGGDRGVTFTRAYGIDIRSGRVTTTVRVTPANRGDTVLLAGRPCLAGNRMFWPGYQDRECMVCELDLDSGRVAASAYVPATYAGIGYSVFAQNGILFTVAGTDYSRGAGQLAVRFNQSAILDAARKAAEADTGNADAALRYGLLCLRLGDAAEAVRRLKAAFDLASRAPVNTRVRDHASRALVAWHLKRADASLAARRYTDAMGSVQSAREFALSRSQRSDCFVREEAALQGLAGTRALRELYEGLVQNDPDFGVGEDPEIPARLYGLIRLAAMLETAEPETAARMYQEIQESPDRLAWQGTPLRVLGLHRLRALVKTHGVKLYAAQEQAAQKLLDANTAETLAELLRRYPLAECADEAALRLAGRALARGDGSAAVAVLLAALEDNTARPRRAELQATLALAHARAGEKLRARLVAARTLREFPDGKLRLGEGETRFADVLGPLVAAGANAGAKSALPRLPARPVALWSRDWEPGSFTRVPAHPAHSAMSRVYLGERSQQGLQVTALDGPSGEVVWSRASDVTLMAAHDTDYGVLFETAQGFGLYEDSGTERWSLAVGATPSQASLEGGMLVFSTRFTNTTTRRQMVRVHALDVSSGGRLWQQEFEASMVRWIGQCPHGVLVLLSGGEQKLYLLDAETGAEIRSVTVDLSGQVNVTPALDGDRLWLVDVFGQVRAYGTRDLGAGATFATGQRGTALLRVEEGRLVLAGLEGATCLEAATGKTLWSRALDRGEMLRAAHHSPGLVYLCTRNAAGESRVTAVRAGDGSVAMRYLAPRAAESDRMELQGSFAFDGGLAVGYSVHSMVQGNMQLSEFRLVVLDNDGSQRLNWSTPANNARAPIMQIAVTDGFLLLGCADTTFCFGHRP